ncbi:MSCRAMM family protein [Hyalangium rubrum]|uniref:Carboxypeptidase regulatory-like domain-containing protein n=1 Tax=Hyalangium rubrum TaxID=3103134 RepID=A0ABU5H7Z3_9BACT|nr:carboxypeptidase regulatory-like domain-containing protein [Hyalangium sp. s54d21]MDY7229004.1 carboxypeptidase regulatory-like domain-containing protein [Hyalangium sp. s54d21]
MARPRHTPAFLALLALTLVTAPVVASAQEEPALEAGPALERVALRLRYGVALREGAQVDPGPGLTYSGLTPNDVAVWGTVYGLGLEWLGAQLGVQREAFTLNRESTLVTEGSLLRASAGLVARGRLGPVRGELGAGYGFAQLPTFSDSADPEPVFQRGGRHAALLSGRLRFPLFLRAQGELRGEFPLAFSAQDAAGGGASAKGFGAGAALLFPVKQAGHWEGALVLDYQYVQDRLTADSGVRSEQTLQRVGAALQLSWFDADVSARSPGAGEPQVRPGALAVQVLDAETGTPMAGAQVTFLGEGAAQAPRATDAQGQVLEPELAPGEVVARVSASGYEPAEGRATVAPGGRATLEVRARKLPPPVGSLRIAVTDKRGNVPMPEVTVVVGEREVRTDAAGQARLEKLPPGPVQVKVSVAGFQPVEEAVVIVAGQEAVLPIPLQLARRVGFATIAGTVRSTQGRPLAATLVIPAAKVRSRADAKGSFSLKLKPGTYRIIISAKGYLTQTKSVIVRDGEQAIFNVDLFPRPR